MTNVEALQALYVALGGTASDVANCTTIVEVLNAIAAMYDGDDNAITNPDAIANIAAVVDNMIPDPTLIEKSITANGTYAASADNADGYSEVTVNVPAPTLTGWPMVQTFSKDDVYAAIGYYNNAPTQIQCVLQGDQSSIPNFTVLGWVYNGM